MKKLYECEELIKKYTKDNYEQKDDYIFTVCQSCNFWVDNYTEKTQKISLVTGYFKCEKCRKRRNFRRIYCTSTRNYKRRVKKVN